MHSKNKGIVETVRKYFVTFGKTVNNLTSEYSIHGGAKTQTFHYTTSMRLFKVKDMSFFVKMFRDLIRLKTVVTENHFV